MELCKQHKLLINAPNIEALVLEEIAEHRKLQYTESQQSLHLLFDATTPRKAKH